MVYTCNGTSDGCSVGLGSGELGGQVDALSALSFFRPFLGSYCSVAID